MSNHQKGFTLIELVIVIVILGILAATALPRFMDVSNQAHESAVAGTGGSFGTSVMLTHASWVASGSRPACLDGSYVDADADPATPTTCSGTSVAMTATGWPLASNATTCVTDVWNTIMQNPPSASDAAGSNYLVTFAGGLCIFDYRGKASLPGHDLDISYNTANGQVTVDNTLDGL